MKNNFPEWLTKQIVHGVRGFNLDAYLMALEGWRRGLKLRWYLDPSKVSNIKIIGFFPLGKFFSLSSKEKTHFFYRSRGDKVNNKAVKVATNKQETKQRLVEANITVPEGSGFNANKTVEDIVDYGMSLGFPLVVKPIYGSLGKGVSTNIRTEESLRKSIQHVRDIGYNELIVERYTPGDDYRVYVNHGQVVGAIKRLPANVVGDGKRSIKQLINLKNKQRKENPYLRTKLIKVDDELNNMIQKRNYTLESIPKEGERVYLRQVANISAGGDPIEAMGDLTPEVKNIAINTLKAIPGLTHAGIDLLINKDQCTVIEINPTADISMHVFPFDGQPINIPEAIMDSYFPETKDLAKDRTKVYFDYRRINQLLQRAVIQEFQVTDAPIGKLYAKRYVITGKVQKTGYRRWIRRQAKKRNLHGYTRNLRNGKVVVVIGSDDKKEVDDFKEICLQGPPRARVDNIQEYIWNTQVKVGFEIRRTNRHKRRKRK